MRDRLRLAPGCAAVLALAALACGGPDDEAQIVEAIERGRRAAAAGDLAELRALVADDYADEDGRDRAALLGTVGAFLRQFPARHVVTRVRGVDLDGDAATAVVVVAIAGAAFEDGDGDWPDLRELDGDVLRVTLGFGRRGGAWRVTSAAWRDASPGDLL